MTAAQAVLAWHRKAALLLESRLRSVVAEDTAYPDWWADQLRITAGTDTQSSPTGSTPEPTLPAVDIVVRSSEVEDHTTSRTVRIYVDVLATVEIDQSVSSSIYGALTAALADEAANVLVQYGRDPTNGGACYLVVLESSAVPDFGDGALSPQTYRATASIRVELSVPLSVSATYAPQSVSRPELRGAYSGDATIGGETAAVLRRTVLDAQTGPVEVDLSAVFDWSVGSSLVVAVTAPGGNVTHTETLVSGVASVDADGVAGTVWTVTAADGTTGDVIVLVIEWSA